MRSYYLSFTAANLNHPNLYGFLQDSYTGSSTPINLNGNTVYRFSVNCGYNAICKTQTVFGLYFTTGILFCQGVTPVPVISYTSVKAWQQNSNVAVQWQVDHAINVSQYEVEKSIDGIIIYMKLTLQLRLTANANSTYNWIDDISD